MAEDKRVRISADASGMQTLRQELAQFYNELERQSSEWRRMSERDIEAIYQQWDRLARMKESFQRQAHVPDWRMAQMFPGFNAADSRLTSLQLDRIQWQLAQNQQGAQPTPSAQPTTPSPATPAQPAASGGAAGGGTDWQGALRNLLSGNLSGAFGSIVGGAAIFAGLKGLWGVLGQGFERSTAIYSADSSIGRQLERNRFWDLLPWEKARNDRMQMGLAAYQGNLASQYGLASLYGVSSDDAFRMMMYGGVRGGDSVTGQGGRVAGGALNAATYGAMIGGGVGTFIAGPLGTAVGGGIGAAVGGAAGAINQAIVERNAERMGYEIQNAYSYVLGKNISEAGQDIAALRRAGVKGDRTGIDDIFNAMVGQKIYNLDLGAITGAAGATRFGAEQGRGVGSVMSSLEQGLKRVTANPTEIGVRLQENLDLYSKMASSLLSTRGSFEQSDVIGAINTLSGLGFEGAQLERLTSGLLGSTSSSSFAKAFRLQAAAQEGASSPLELQAALEAPTVEMNKRLLENLWRRSGGNRDWFGLQMTQYGFNARDVLDLINKGGAFNANGEFDVDALYEGLTKGGTFDVARAAELTTEYERSRAGTTNRNIAEGGIQAMEGDLASSFKELSAKVDKLLTETLNVKIMAMSPSVTDKLNIRKQLGR